MKKNHGTNEQRQGGPLVSLRSMQVHSGASSTPHRWTGSIGGDPSPACGKLFETECDTHTHTHLLEDGAGGSYVMVFEHHDCGFQQSFFDGVGEVLYTGFFAQYTFGFGGSGLSYRTAVVRLMTWKHNSMRELCLPKQFIDLGGFRQSF